MNTFDHTRAALIIYDAGKAERAKNWDDICNDIDVAKAGQADREALELVQRAYYEDTKDINCIHNCLRIDIDFMRRMTIEFPPVGSAS